MSQAPYSISKTSFLKFDQCPKAFFLYKNFPYLKDKIGVDKQLTFKRGHQIGFFAQQLFPGGRDVSKETKNAAAALELTATLIQSREPVIYEATFVHNGVLIMVDILHRQEENYVGYEVKSSLRVSDTYIKDACLQYYVLRNQLPGFEDLFLVTLNADYVLETEEVDPRKLFKKRSIKQKAEANAAFFETQVANAHLVLEQNVIPNIAIGKHCFRPYTCDYFGSCWKETIPDNSIFNFPLVDKEKLFEWYNNGVRTIPQLSDEQLEKETLIRIRDAFVTNSPIIHLQKLKLFLANIQWPAAAIDMEIWNPAIPQLKGTRPFEQIPFLVCFYDGTNNLHYFTNHWSDQRKEFAQRLAELAAPYATLLVYDKTMEISVIDSLIRAYPDLKPGLENVKAKLVDVFDVFLGLMYYHPGFKTNFSLKATSQYLLPEVVYPAISSGLEAMSYFDQHRTTTDAFEKERMRTELILYCQTDVEATFKLVQFLKTLIN